MVDFSFLKKLQLPKFSFRLPIGPASFVGIDVGSAAVKVVQLRREQERAILETYGELETGRYPRGHGAAGGAQGYDEPTLAAILTDVLREANVTTKRAVFGIPAAASLVTAVSLPELDPEELSSAIPFEAKKYVPIPLPEAILDWQVLETDQASRRTTVLLAAVPREVVSGYERLAQALGLALEGVEIESFSVVRSLLAAERGVSAVIHLGAAVTTLTVVAERKIRMNHNVGRGGREITSALAQSLGVAAERAESLKREVGLSEKPEEREVAEAIGSLLDGILADVERALANYHRSSPRRVEKLVLSGGGAKLPGLVAHVAKRFGLETAIGDPFSRTVFPVFLQPVLQDIAPGFAVAVGLALRQISSP